MDGLTGDQRFFAGMGPGVAREVRDDLLRQQVMADVHAPDIVRATGPLPNVDAFYTAFGVTAGDKLFLPPEQRMKNLVVEGGTTRGAD